LRAELRVCNLIANAIKFTPADGRVDVRLARANGSAVIEVADTDIGIPSNEQSRIFERFFRTSTATAKAIPGTGLGLSIMKAIAEAHGGTAAFSSAVGRGTTFRVALPLD
jgi:signal transduction histidine kinase